MRSLRIALKAGAIQVLSALVFAGAQVHAQGGEIVADRGPRFLLAAGDAEARTVPLDVSRTAMLRGLVRLDFDNATIKSALAALTQQSGVELVYSDDVLPRDVRVTLHAQGIAVAAALTHILLDAGVDVVLLRNGTATLRKQPVQPTVGMITGQVMDSSTKQATWGAKVSVQGTKLNTSTDAEGRFTIRQVPVGDRVVSVRFLGYTPTTRSMTVVENQTATVNFFLTRAPTKLTDLVTTATGDRRRLEVGNSVGSIQADSIVPTTLIRNMSDLLQARVPGVVVANTDGAVGAPSKVRLRGVNSLVLNNDPIVIVDGVRVLSQATSSFNQTDVGSTQMLPPVGGNFVANTLAPARLDDFDPNTIESIDVLRGPSAATLYGTDAANGVIVIKTKRGKAGAWRATVTGDQGWSNTGGRTGDAWWGFGRRGLGYPTARCNLAWGGEATVASGTCVQDSVRNFNYQNNPLMRTLGTGTAQTTTMNLSGGSEQLQQFFSLRASDNVGMSKMSEAQRRFIQRFWSTPAPSWMIRPNTEQDFDGSSRTTFLISPKADVSLSVTGIRRNVLNGGPPLTSFGNIGQGVSSADTLTWLPSDDQRTKRTSAANRGVLATTANYKPWTWLRLNGTVGGDYTLRTDQADIRAQDCTLILQIERSGSGVPCKSGHNIRRDENFVRTVNVGAEISLAPRPWLQSRTSLGEQYSRTTYYSLQAGNNVNFGCQLAFGTQLLTPAPTCSNQNRQMYQLFENRDAAASAGWYVEQSIGLFGLYTNFGLRQDVSSAFGGQVNKSPPNYPKFSLSYLLSDQSFYPKQTLVPSLRLRLAYGHSGNAGSRAAVLNEFGLENQTIAGQSQPTTMVFLQRLGNPELKPERATEWEGGFDVSFLENERVHAEVTMYKKFTRDAINPLDVPPSFGIESGYGQQFFNLGNVLNRGLEASTTARILDTRQISWDLSVNVTRNTNKLVSRAPNLTSLGSSVNHVGYPLFAYWGPQVVGYTDRNGDGILSLDEVTFGPKVFLGAPYPKSELTYSTGLSLFNGALHVNAGFDQVNGLVVINQATNVQPRAAVDPTSSLAAQAGFLQAVMLGDGYYPEYRNETNSLRFNELSLTYNAAPKLVERYLHVRSAAVTVAGRNLALWTNYVGRDPNIQTIGRAEETSYDDGSGAAQPRNWTIRFNLGF